MKFKKHFSIFLAVSISIGSALMARAERVADLTADEIIAKHIQAVGGKDAIAKARMRMALGNAEFIQRSLVGQKVTGNAVLASDGTDYAWYSTFSLVEYPKERIGIFANKVDIPFLREGARSPLGSYLMVNDWPLNDRLFGGAIFSTWRLFNPQNDGKFETDGKKKVNGREALIIRFRPKSGLRAGSSIRLFFDAETFNHVRTEMKLTEPDKGFYEINGRNTEMSTGMASNGSSLVEDFGDFKPAAGLVLPYKYTVDLTIDGARGTAQFKWDFNLVEYRVVNDFGKGFFSFST